jgi:hypothetical protein
LPPQRPLLKQSLMSETHTYRHVNETEFRRDKAEGEYLGALVQTEDSICASFKTIEPSSRRGMIRIGTVLAREPRAFPESPTRLTLPTTIRNEMLELYAFIFCQGGFRQLGMTFEQFLLVAAAIKPVAIRGDCSLMAEGRYI